MTQEQLLNFFDCQLRDWPLAAANYKALDRIEKKAFRAGDLEGRVEFNPARAVSSLAKLDATAIKERPCFLCRCNRPPEQKSLPMLEEKFELLVNPYPILPFHFTIASLRHEPQKLYPEYGEALARHLPGMIVFFNGDGAGASAPDHLHFQAVAKGSLPLIELMEKSEHPDLPFKVFQGNCYNTERAVNAFFWLSEDSAGVALPEVKSLIIPRTKHRPNVFFQQPPARRAVSPGAIDMAGVIVSPVKEDFDAITPEEIEKIYREVGC